MSRHVTFYCYSLSGDDVECLGSGIVSQESSHSSVIGALRSSLLLRDSNVVPLAH